MQWGFLFFLSSESLNLAWLHLFLCCFYFSVSFVLWLLSHWFIKLSIQNFLIKTNDKLIITYFFGCNFFLNREPLFQNWCISGTYKWIVMVKTFQAVKSKNVCNLLQNFWLLLRYAFIYIISVYIYLFNIYIIISCNTFLIITTQEIKINISSIYFHLKDEIVKEQIFI